MQNAQTYLEIIRQRGERRLELSRVYRNLQNRELFLRAYAKLYANKGALTPGTDADDTVDGMSLKRIEDIIQQLEAGKYQWKPTRRTYRRKPNGKYRPLSISSWNDKLLQEVIRTVLTAYYEPQFSNSSHGFRPGRGCHTALSSIVHQWKGTKWFIEGDIKGCFDNINHDKLLEIIGRNIKDERLLKLLRGMLEVGYLEDWQYHQTYSGTPQGGVLSPLLSNIFLNELDRFIEEELIPKYTKGDRRRTNPEYARLTYKYRQAREKENVELAKALDKERKTLPYGDPNDPDFRRLRYVRYADDFLLGFTGPKAEAEEIKEEIKHFLDTIGLAMSNEKTLITHATEGKARFLSYDVYMAKGDSRRCENRRSINGTPMLGVPKDVAQKWRNRFKREGKILHRYELINLSDYDITMVYNLEFQGLVNYYTMAHDVANKLYPVKLVYQQSLLKTLATKHKQNVRQMYKKYYRKSENGVSAVVVTVPREGKTPLIARLGAKPIRFNARAFIQETIPTTIVNRNEVVKRMLADVCELCGSTKDVEVHHIRKLKDLQRRYQGRPNPPMWVVRMIEIRRKTLVVCKQCHREIEKGKYDGPKLRR